MSSQRSIKRLHASFTPQSIPKKFRPLPNRLNIVLSQSGALRGAPSLVVHELTFACR